MAIPFDYIPVGVACRLPDGGTGEFFFVSRAELDAAEELGQTERLAAADFIPMALSSPDVIFQGLQRANQHRSWCYCIRPTRQPDDDEEEGDFLDSPQLPIRPGEVFVVYVRLAPAGGYLVFDWEWREEDEEKGCYPVHYLTDFERIAWTPN